MQFTNMLLLIVIKLLKSIHRKKLQKIDGPYIVSYTKIISFIRKMALKIIIFIIFNAICIKAKVQIFRQRHI